jgi:large subunit ribosomal protein L30
MTSPNKYLILKLVKSLNGRLPNHIACAKGLGLTKMHREKLLLDTPEIRGMVRKIAYLLEVEEVEEVAELEEQLS